MKKSKLKSKARAALREMGEEVLELRGDHLRRFRNALLCVMSDDPIRGARWVRANLPEQVDDLTRADLLLVEAYARARVFRHYAATLGRINSYILFRPDWAFDDDGALTPG